MNETTNINLKVSTDPSGAIRGLNSIGDATTSLETRTRSLGSMIHNSWRSIAATLGGVIAGREILDLAKSSLDAADSLNKLSQSTGTTVEELSALGYAARLSDVSQEGLSTGLKKLSKNMLDAAAGTGEGRDAFAAMGVSVKNAAGGLRTTGDILEDLAEKFSSYEDSAAKTALAQKIFGRSGADLIPLLNQGREGLAAMAAEADRLGLVLTKETTQAAENFNDNLTRLRALLEGFANRTLREVLPLLEKYSAELVTAASNSGFLDTASKKAADTLKSVAEKVRDLIDLAGAVPSDLTAAGTYGLVGAILFGGKAGAIIGTLALIDSQLAKIRGTPFKIEGLFGPLGSGIGATLKNFFGLGGKLQEAFEGKRSWLTGELIPQAIGVDYEPHGFPKPNSTKTAAPLLAGTAPEELQRAADALKSFQASIDAMDPSISEWDKRQQSLTQSAEKLIEQYGKYPGVIGDVAAALGKGQGFIDLERQLSINEENIKLSEDLQRSTKETMQAELEAALQLLDVDHRRAAARLDAEHEMLSLRHRYGEVSTAEAATRGFDIAIERLRIQKENTASVIRERSERALIDDDGKGILELLLAQKLTEAEINRLLGIRSLVLREHAGTMAEGFSAGWKSYIDEMGSQFQRGETYAKQTASAMHQAFEDFFMDPATYSWESFWKDLQRVAARAMSDITMDMVGQFVKGLSSVNFFGAGSFDFFGLGSPATNASATPASQEVTVTVNDYNQSAVAASATRTPAGGLDIELVVENIVTKKFGQANSRTNQAIQQNYNVSQRLIRR